MNFERLRRFIFSMAALALLLVTVLPNNIVNAGMAGEHLAVVTVSAKMPCPDCNSSMMKGGTSTCAQIACIGFAIITESDLILGKAHGTFFQTTAMKPDEVFLAPATPPI